MRQEEFSHVGRALLVPPQRLQSVGLRNDDWAHTHDDGHRLGVAASACHCELDGVDAWWRAHFAPNSQQQRLRGSLADGGNLCDPVQQWVRNP